MAIISGSQFFGGKPGKVVQPADIAPVETGKSWFERFRDGVGETVGGAILRAGDTVAERIPEIDATISRYQEGKQGLGSTAAQVIGQGLGIGADAIGEGVSTVFKGITTPELRQDMGQIASDIFLANPEAQKQDIADLFSKWQEYKTKEPVKAANIAAAGNIVDFLLNATGIGIGAKAASAGLKEGEIVGKSLLHGAEDLAKTSLNVVEHTATKLKPSNILKKVAELKYGEDGVKAVAALEKAYSEIPLPKNVLREEAETGKSFARFMSEKPEVKIGVKNMKYDTFGAAQKLRQEAKVESEALSDLLKNRVETISFDSVEQQVKNAISETFTGQERDAAIRYVENEFDALRKQLSGKTIAGANGEQLLKLSDANDLKQSFWDKSPFSPTASRSDKLASSIDYKIGSAFKNEIQNAIPDVDVQALNQQLGDYYHTIEVLENLHGGAAPRGRIGLEFARIGGAITGSQGGIVGSIVGYMTADKIAKFMVEESLSQTFKRYAIEKLFKSRPKVAEQVIEILKKQQGEEAARLLLPEPSFIPTNPYKGGESGINTRSVENFSRERAAVQAENEKDVFKFNQDKEARATTELRNKIQKVEKARAATVTSAQDALSSEARKYKTAEEFVGAQRQKVFRGGKSNEITEKGLSVSTNEQVAKEFALARKGTVSELYISPSAKIVDIYDIPTLAQDKAIFDYNKVNPPFADKGFMSVEGKYQIAAKWAREHGYDAVKLPTEGEIRIVNPDVLKTKSQLTDIWNKAQKAKRK